MATEKRAKTDEEKREVIERLYKVWTNGTNAYLRFGQMLGNVIRTEQQMYNIEDFDLVEEIEGGYNKAK